jgi:uncharacterized repeat protein (TIGR01451 family)
MSHRLSAAPAFARVFAHAHLAWRRLAGCALLLATASLPAAAQVAVNQILFPSNIGRALAATVSIDVVHTGSASGDVTIALPPQLTADAPAPASGCVAVGSPTTSIVCTVAAGAAGDHNTLTFDVRGVQVGSFNLAATSSSSSASNTGTVRESGEITVAHSKLPAGNPAIGQTVVFSFGARIAAGGDALPSGAVLTLSDQLPGLSANFSVTDISSNSSNASCNSAANADSSRTVTCNIAGPLSLAQVNAISITVTGTHGSSGNFVNVVSVLAQPSAYFDQDSSNNTSNLAYTVGAGSADVAAQGSFIGSAVATGSTQVLTLNYFNNGPSNLPSGGRISTTLPAGFRVNSLPAGCSGPAVGALLASPTALNCGTGPVNNNESQTFAVPLTMPLAAGSGSFILSTALPAGYNDNVPANDTLTLPWQAVVLAAGQAQVTVVKSSSLDGVTWVDDPATPPTISASNAQMRWRIRITTPSAAPQTTINTLTLTDSLPGVLDVASPGAPAPAYQTPQITVATSVLAGSAGGSCPNVAAGNTLLTCNFSSVAPGTTIQVLITVNRPFFSSDSHLNTATVTSPDAVLSGTVSDSAALQALPRTDVAATSLTLTPANPRIGQALQFTLTAQNLGPDQNEIGEFRLIDDFNTSTAGSSVAYGDIVASGSGMNCAIAATALSDEPALPAGHVRLRCTNTTAVARYSTRTVTVTARVLKPASLPPSGSVYTSQANTLRVLVPTAVCEYKTETSTNGLLSAACNDAAASSNNSRSLSFDVALPLVDLQQRATRVLPGAQTSFSFGQPLRYRFRIQNNGPSRAEAVQMTDVLSVPSGFTLSSPVVLNINGTAAETGYVLDGSKTSSVSCSQGGANANLVCVLHTTSASNALDAGREVNFEVEFTQTGTSTTPVSFGTEALVCAAESTAYETYGACNRSAANNNNLAAVNDVVFPRTDLSISKSTLTAMPASINQPVSFSLVVRNLGAEATQRIRVQDVLPANFELVTSGANAPSLTLGSFVTAAPSTATGASLACSASPSTLSTAGQSQTVNCQLEALPGPLGSGAFPGSANSNNALTLRLTAVPKAGLFTGPYMSNLVNTATVSPGLDVSGNPLSLDEVPGNNSSSSNAQVASISLSGRVFNDRNGNGVQDGTSAAQDEGIGGVLITLSGTDLGGNAITRTATTVSVAGSTRGDYVFTDLPAGSYTLTQTQPAGWLNGSGNPPAPSAGGAYSAAASPTTSSYSGLTLTVGSSGLTATGYNFPEALPASVIAGTVFLDRDRNGIQNPGEPGIPGVTLGLYVAGTVCPASGALPANPLQTVTTDASGNYAFAAATPGADHVVCEQQPTGYGDATPQPGSGNSTPGANQINVPALSASGSPGNQFPERLGSIAGTVFVDFSAAAPGSSNGNGLQDSGEPGLGSATPGAGIPITLSGTLSSNGLAIAPQTVTTAADGNFSFADLQAGSYTLAQGATPAALGVYNDGINTAGSVAGGGTPGAAGAVGDNAIRGIVLAAGATSSGNTFAELPATAISGLVYIDRNRDGQLTAADPGRLAGVSIELRRGGSNCASASLLGSTLSAADGSFAFPGGSVSAAQVSAGQSYRICQVQPAAYADGSTTPGAGGSSPAANEILISSLPASGSSGHLFGERAASIAGRVFLDAANDGLFNGSDSGIPGVVLTLTGGSLPPAGSTGVFTNVTGADGSYRFDDLPAGSYDLLQAAAQPTVTVAGAPVMTLNGQTRAGTTAGAPGVPLGTATPVSTVPSAVRGIALPAGADSAANDFAEILPSQVSGSVYNDNNNDGTRQGGESGYPNQTITLTGTDDLGRPVNVSAITDASGNFSLSDLRPGSYTLTQPSQPAGSSNGITTPGSAGGAATPVATVPSAISGIVLVPGQSSSGNLFAELSSAPDLVVTQSLLPAIFTELNTGSYTLTVANLGQIGSSGVITVTDTLPAGLTAVGLPRGNGWTCSVAGQVFTCTSSQPIAAGATSPSTITLDVTVDRGACTSFPCTLTNVVAVSGGGEPAASGPTPAELSNPPLCTTPQPTQNVCRVPTPVQQSGGVAGTVWLDVDHDRLLTASDIRQAGFGVELYQGGQLLRSTTTDARGDYQLTGLVPGAGYELRFKDPATGAYYGRPISADPAGGNDPAAFGPAGVVPGGAIQNLSIPGGNAVRVNQNLPLDPNGVVYDSQSRQPVAGAVVELLTPAGDPVPTQCVLGGVNRVTTATTGTGVVPGGYAFWLANPQPAGCAGDGAYQLRVTPPAGYLNAGRASDGSPAFTSALLPAAGNLASVPSSCQVYVPGGACAIQAQAVPPTGSQPTPYYFRIPLTPATPVAFVEIVNNHIPLDPFGGTRFVITKQAAARNAELGDTMRYTIVVRHIDGPPLPNVRVDDALPAGFRYIPGTFRVGGTLQADPAGSPGPRLSFPLGTLPVNGQISFTYFLRVGVGAQQGDGINTAQGVSVSGAEQVLSNIARAQVKVTGGVFSNEACVLGKVFVDCNGNMVQDREELGIPGVRLVLQDGTFITTDSEGKYSYCGLPPRTQVLKVDALTLPRGARLVTSSSRNAGDANSLFLDPKNGELHRADFIEGSCSNTVLEQVKARRAQGEVRAVESEGKGTPALKFEGKAPGYPQQGTDSANQTPVKPRVPASENGPPPAPVQPSQPENNVPVPQLPAASQNTQRK